MEQQLTIKTQIFMYKKKNIYFIINLLIKLDIFFKIKLNIINYLVHHKLLFFFILFKQFLYIVVLGFIKFLYQFSYN